MEDKKDLLINYIKANVAPILTNILTANEFLACTIIPSNITLEELIGTYENLEFETPSWYQKNISNENKILVIDKIDAVSKKEQQKFIELLKYKKIGTLTLPDNTVIIITATNINKEVINEEIYSLSAHI